MRSDSTTTNGDALPGHRWQGRYSDGRSAASRSVTVMLDPDGVAVRDDTGLELVWPYARLSSATPLGPDARDIVLSPHAKTAETLFIPDPAFAKTLATIAPHLTQSGYRKTGLRFAAPFGIAAAVAIGTVTLFDLSPSKAVARLIPQGARDALGKSVLETLPAQRTCDVADGRAALDALVVRLRPDLKDKAHKVSVLDWGLENAFAVPGGSVVLTRAIIAKAASADEIAGVLAHEMGHGLELHPEAGLVRGVGFWALVQTMFTGSPGALGNAGTLLMQLAYTRAYEREADAIALRLLRDAEIDFKAFAGFFRRMEQGRGRSRPQPNARGRASDIFQTHPSSPERIDTIEKQQPYAARPALTEAQWQALRRICGTSIDTANTDIKPKTTAPGSGMDQAEARIRANPTAATGYAERAQIHMRERRFADAIKDYSTAIERDKGSAFYRYERGRAHQNASDFPSAIADYSEAIKLNPRYSNAFAARGAAHRLQNRPRDARTDLDEAIAINPRNDYALYQRGLINAAEQRWADSESDFSRVLAAQRSYALAHVRRAEALEQLKRRDDAITAYRDALGASPSSPDAAVAFGIARDRLKSLGARE